MTSRVRWIFAFGNLFTAALLGVALSVVSVRHVAFDTALIVLAVALSASAIALLANVSWALRALRIAASLLLAVGFLACGIAVLTLVFLSGVHGRWLDAGLPLAWLAVGLIVPYTVIYPLVQLFLSAPSEP